MSDDHSHAEAGHEHDSHETPSSGNAGATTLGEHKCKSDDWFKGIQDYATGKIATFVAFLFLLITLGAFYAVIITGATLSGFTTALILAPALVGLIAYANRDIALLIFGAIVVLLVFIF